MKKVGTGGYRTGPAGGPARGRRVDTCPLEVSRASINRTLGLAGGSSLMARPGHSRQRVCSSTPVLPTPSGSCSQDTVTNHDRSSPSA